MELIDKRQRLPFVLVCVVTAIVIAGSFLITRVVDPTRALSNAFYWYMARSAGLTSYGLLSITVLLGLSNSSGLWDRWRIRKLMTQLHQYTSLLVFPFLFFHVWGLHQDSSVPFQWTTLLVPFTDQYRPIFTGFGILTLYGYFLIIVTSYFRERIGVRVWRSIHILSFPMFVAATLHGLMIGTDSGQLWSDLVYAIPALLFMLLLLKRFSRQTTA